jgi:DNA-binding NarL/FixJ family response regulator
MVYLIDDKKHRQFGEYAWNDTRFKENINKVIPVYGLETLEKLKVDIFKNGNAVLYHESFLDNTRLSGAAAEKRRKLEVFASQHKDFQLAIFSGSKNSRRIDNGNTASLPVSRLYQNLDIFTQKHYEGDQDLRYLLFGSNPALEQELSLQLKDNITEVDKQVEQGLGDEAKVIFVQSYKDPVQNPIVNAKLVKIIKVEDEDLSSFIESHLLKEKYDHVFLPISVGETLSDFNGLRLATHIRCTPGLNQLSNIVIYSFVGIEELMDNEYFGILKTENVSLVPYDKAVFAERASHSPVSELTVSELPKEILKLYLSPPKNYQESHSVKNEWAIYQWAHAIGATDDKEIQRIIGNVEHNIYFKYLKTTTLSNNSEAIPEQELKIKPRKDSKVLLIDDETNKGWYEIFTSLFADRNGIDFHDLGDTFKGLSNHEVISQSVNKVLDDNFDVVILDFRLHPDDFNTEHPDDITSIKILKEVKKKSPGVQVIVFSATNKAWNLQTIQNAGADGFVFKDGSGDIVRSIKNLIGHVNDSLARAKWLKLVFSKLEAVKNSARALNLSDGFGRSLTSNTEIVFQLILKSFEEEKYRNYAYLQLFLLVEDFTKEPSILDKRGGRFYVETKNKSLETLGPKKKIDKKWGRDSNIKWNSGTSCYEKGECFF